ncbi:MAG: hypothetical protein H6726_19145 [Sandaracinaceae bacterium]|nr:hypothetical protein [Sandaracinaceae bacterium]
MPPPAAQEAVRFDLAGERIQRPDRSSEEQTVTQGPDVPAARAITITSSPGDGRQSAAQAGSTDAAQPDAPSPRQSPPVDAYSTRGLVLPRGRLRIDAFARDPALLGSGYMYGEDGSQTGLRFTSTADYTRDGTELLSADVAVGLGLGASYGVTDDLELGIDALPLYFTGNTTVGSFNSRYTNRSGGLGGIPVYGRYAFFRTDSVQIGGQLAIRMLDWGFQLGLPVSIALAGRLRIETGVAFEASQYGKGTTVEYGFVLPAAVSFDLGRRAHIGARLALSYRPDASSFAGGVFAGYLLPLGDRMRLDLQARYSLRLLRPLSGPSVDFSIGAALWFGP